MWKGYLCAVTAAIGCASNDDSGKTGDSVTVTAALAPAAVIAYRDGDGPWTVKSGADAPFTFPVRSGTYTVAIECTANQFEQRVDVYQLTIDDLQNLEYGRECSATPAMLSGRLLGTNTYGLMLQWGQQANYRLTDSTASTYTWSVRSGRHDLVAARNVYIPDRLVIARDVEVAADAQLDIDFEAPDVIMLESRTITGCAVQPAFVSAGGTLIQLGLGISGDPIQVVPATALGDGDLNVFSCSFEHLLQGGVSQILATTHASREAPATIALPARIDDAPDVWITAATGENGLLHATWVAQPDAGLYGISAGVWRAHVSPAIFEATGRFDMPDLSAVAGWDQTLNLKYAAPPKAWGVHVITGALIDELLRPIPSREGEVRVSGWVGEQIVMR